jgi:hypothetical protein
MPAAFPKPTPVVRERKPLRRTSRLRAKRWGIRPRRPRRLDGPGSDPARLDWVRAQPCVLLRWRLWPCEGRTEAHHAGRKPGVALKAGDETTVPLCRRHHRQVTDHTGPFAKQTREAMRVLQDEWIAETTARYLGHGGRRG